MYDWKMPEIVPGMSGATLEKVYIVEGETLPAGTKLFDISVDLSSAFAQECPPISYFRIVLRESACIRRLIFAEGQHIETGSLVALFSTDLNDELGPPAERSVRVATAGIMHHAGMWTASRL
jgi:hypothetical protein